MTQHDFNSEAIEAHKKLRGKIKISAKTKLRDDHELSVYYTPGVGAVSTYLSKNPDQTSQYTIKSDLVAVVSDGSAVLGLGNIGPQGAIPVLEGKAMLFAELAGLDAFPVALDTQDVDGIVSTIKNIAPVFAAINLEDIAAPKCFEVEARLRAELDIPVIHDDQHATAIAVLAGLINALKVTGRSKASATAVIIGAGAAGNAAAKLLVTYGIGDVIVVDSKGVLSDSRADLDDNKKELAKITNKTGKQGDLASALRDTDVLIGLSGPNLVTSDMVKSMAKDPIVFAMANPTPEIMPDVAIGAGAAVVATGRSDFPNQINNVLVFPGMFKGAIEAGLNKIDDTHKLLASQALADVVENPNPEKIIPSVFDKSVVPAIVSSLEKKV